MAGRGRPSRAGAWGSPHRFRGLRIASCCALYSASSGDLASRVPILAASGQLCGSSVKRRSPSDSPLKPICVSLQAPRPAAWEGLTESPAGKVTVASLRMAVARPASGLLRVPLGAVGGRSQDPRGCRSRSWSGGLRSSVRIRVRHRLSARPGCPAGRRSHRRFRALRRGARVPPSCRRRLRRAAGPRRNRRASSRRRFPGVPLRSPCSAGIP